MIPTDAEYLGDGVYGRWDGFQIELFTFNGVRKSESIFLEDKTLHNVVSLYNRSVDAQKEAGN